MAELWSPLWSYMVIYTGHIAAAAFECSKEAGAVGALRYARIGGTQIEHFSLRSSQVRLAEYHLGGSSRVEVHLERSDRLLQRLSNGS